MCRDKSHLHLHGPDMLMGGGTQYDIKVKSAMKVGGSQEARACVLGWMFTP